MEGEITEKDKMTRSNQLSEPVEFPLRPRPLPLHISGRLLRSRRRKSTLRQASPMRSGCIPGKCISFCWRSSPSAADRRREIANVAQSPWLAAWRRPARTARWRRRNVTPFAQSLCLQARRCWKGKGQPLSSSRPTPCRDNSCAAAFRVRAATGGTSHVRASKGSLHPGARSGQGSWPARASRPGQLGQQNAPERNSRRSSRGAVRSLARLATRQRIIHR